MRRFLFVLPVLVFLGVSVGLAIGLTRDPSVLPSALLDQPLPVLSLPPIEAYGETGLQSDDLPGEPVLINVFASWCAPCRIEHPVLDRLTREEGVPLYGINYKDQPAAAAAWLVEMGDPYAAIGADADGRAAIDLGVYGVPETFIVDGDGRIVYRHAGAVMPRDVEQTILPILKSLQ